MTNKRITKVLVAGVMATTLIGSVINPYFFKTMKVSAGQQLGQTDFDDGVGLPWHICESIPGKMEFDISGGKYNITIINPGGAQRGGEDRWDCQFRHRGLKIVKGHKYKISYEITASNSGQYYTKIGNLDAVTVGSAKAGEVWHSNTGPEDYDSNWGLISIGANETKKVEMEFVAIESLDVAEWAFHFGGAGQYTPQDCFPAGTVLSFDNMSLIDLTSDENDFVHEEPYQRKEVLLNQLGYYQNLNKKATLISDSKKEIGFEIYDSSDNKVYSGKSIPHGFDEDSGDDVHILDFSDFDEVGTGYYIKANNGATSYPFEISDGNLYTNMLYDALKYFYHNRSGIDIEEKYVYNSQWARAAGHNPDKATTENVSTGSSWDYTENYTLDVTGGWYDAGDHGKYIVNGGISVWTMQNQYERVLANNSEYSVMYDDCTMNIPESGNGYPDILDEARYELEWMHKMIVPDDSKYAGMVYHKVHDESWTGLAIEPAADEQPRIIKPPTTAATLNVSAVSAQGYRLWKDLDSSFADKCLEIAEKTYEAAKKHPDRYAPLDESIGGGAYGDDNVTDEFYWAACELFIATGDEKYYSDMKKSKHFLEMPTVLVGGEETDTVGSFNWGHTAALGNLSLSITDNDLSSSELDTVKDNIISAADFYIEIEESQGYGIPLKPCTVFNLDIKGYPWGSNSFVVNSAIVMAYAYDFTEDEKYLNGVTTAMDYIMGRNPVDYSYVTGYGSHYAENPHHRFWSNQVDKNFPKAPSGILVGGPNSGMQDPWVKGSGWKLGQKDPQLCYLDHIEAWSVNECTINWNTPLAWITGYLTETNCDVDDIIIGGAHGVVDVSAGNKDNSSKSSDSKKDKSSDNKKETKKKDTDKDNKIGLIPILIFILLVIISLEVFIYFMVKMSKGKNKKENVKDIDKTNNEVNNNEDKE